MGTFILFVVALVAEWALFKYLIIPGKCKAIKEEALKNAIETTSNNCTKPIPDIHLNIDSLLIIVGLINEINRYQVENKLKFDIIKSKTTFDNAKCIEGFYVQIKYPLGIITMYQPISKWDEYDVRVAKKCWKETHNTIEECKENIKNFTKYCTTGKLY